MPIELLLIIMGASCYGFAVYLDKAMDYGHALSIVRFKVMYWFANKKHRELLLQVDGVKTFGDRIVWTDKIYMDIVLYRRFLLIMLCPRCMSFWFILYTWWIMGFGWINLLILVGSASIISFLDK